MNFLSNNKNNNALDFIYLSSRMFGDDIYSSSINVENFLRQNKSGRVTPKAEDIDKLNKDKYEYLDYLTKQYTANGNKNYEAIIKDGNGCYVYPTVIFNTIDENENNYTERFSRIYVGLKANKILDFIKIVNDKALSTNLQYYFKFYSNEGTDKVVFYPKNESMSQLCDIMMEISKIQPELFEGAENKFFTQQICNGVSIASDNPASKGLSFTRCMSHYMNPYFQNEYNKINFKATKNAFYYSLRKYLVNNYSDKYQEKEITEICKNHLDEVYGYMEKHKEGEKPISIIIKDNNGKPIIIYPTFKLKLSGYSDEEIIKIQSQVAKFDNFNKFVEDHKNDVYKDYTYFPSRSNLAFSDKQILMLSKISEKSLRQEKNNNDINLDKIVNYSSNNHFYMTNNQYNFESDDFRNVPKNIEAIKQFIGNGNNIKIQFLKHGLSAQELSTEEELKNFVTEYSNEEVCYNKEQNDGNATKSSMEIFNDAITELQKRSNQYFETKMVYGSPMECLVSDENGPRGIIKLEGYSHSDDYTLITCPEVCDFSKIQTEQVQSEE